MAADSGKDKANGIHNHDTKSDDDEFDIPELECEVCNKTFSGPATYEIHINGNKHLKKVQALKIKKNMDMGKDTNGETTNDRGDSISCTLCKMDFSGFLPYKQHLKSSKHLKQLEREKIKDTLKNTPQVKSVKKKPSTGEIEENDLEPPTPYGECDICSKTFYVPEALKQHMESTSHKKKMAQLKMKQDFRNSYANSNDAGVAIAEDDKQPEKVLTSHSFAECKSCEKKFSGPESLKMHLDSDAHKRKVESQKLAEDLKGKHDDKYEVLENGEHLCKECGKKFMDFAPLLQHLRNNLHAKKNVKKNIAGSLENHPEITVMPLTVNESTDENNDLLEETADFYICKLCRRSFSGPECAMQHVQGKKHKRAKEIKRRLENSDEPKKTLSANHDDNSIEQMDKKPESKKQEHKDDDDDFEVVG